MDSLNIIYEDEHIIVLHKPSGIATQTDRVTEPDLYSMVCNHLKGAYVGIINRLDQPVEGIVLMAKTKTAAANLSKQLKDNTIEKYYRASVYLGTGSTPSVSEDFVRLSDHIVFDRKNNMSRICDQSQKDAKYAELEYRIIKVSSVSADLDIKLITGRHHQIRVQLSGAGMPILGDTKYGTKESISYSRDNGYRSIALCAYRLKIFHPADGSERFFEI